MLASSKIKWIGSIFLAGIFLALSMMGGNWGTTYTADASMYAVPHISSIVPAAVPAGSSDTGIIIFGSNFGNVTDTRVWLTSTGFEELITPMVVTNTAISLVLSDTLLVEPKLYIVTVIKSVVQTVPTLPPVPIKDEISNGVPFTVYEARSTYLPVIDK